MLNLEAENYLLGSILREPDLIKEISLSVDHFGDPTNAELFRVMKHIESKGEPVNLATIFLSVKGKEYDVGGMDYVNQLARSVPSVEPYKTYEKYVLEAWKLRKAWEVTEVFRESFHAHQDSEIISDTIRDLTKIEEEGYTGDFDINAAMDLLDEGVRTEKDDIGGIDTGYHDLNLLTNGWQDGDLTVVAARPSIGKTAFALNMAKESCARGVCTSVFSLEMRDQQLLKRMVSAIGNIDATVLRNPFKFFVEEDWIRYKRAQEQIRSYNIHIYDQPAVTVQEIRARLRKLKRKYPEQKHITFIDYLQLIKGSGRENRVQEVAEMSRELKLIARELDMPVIVLSQLSRAVEQRQNKRPMLSDLRESGSIEQDADNVLFLYRDDYYDQNTENKNIIEVIVGKQRNGPIGAVELVFLKEFNKFVELSRRAS